MLPHGASRAPPALLGALCVRGALASQQSLLAALALLPSVSSSTPRCPEPGLTAKSTSLPCGGERDHHELGINSN